MRVATWNLEWARAGTPRGERISRVIDAVGADVWVVTEGSGELLPAGGHVIDAGGDWGYGPQERRRKIIAWSREPWRSVATVDDGACRGRVVRGTTTGPLGEVAVVAVCIPWSGAHVATGRRDARMWGEHVECCARLATLDRAPRTILAGDLNQRIPRHRQPHRVAAALDAVLDGWTVWTAGDTSVGRLIDHVATTPGWHAAAVECWPGTDHDGRLSDHSGVVATLVER